MGKGKVRISKAICSVYTEMTVKYLNSLQLLLFDAIAEGFDVLNS